MYLPTKLKKYRLLFFIQLVLMAPVLFSCQHKKPARKIERSFYYWKSVFQLNPYEQQQIKQLQVKTIYIKFFDVDWDASNRQPIPVAKLQTSGYQLPPDIQVIPTVFITNECIAQLDTQQIRLLSAQLTNLVIKMCAANQLAKPPSEIQIDCDWTSATREKYFALLTFIKELSQATLSVTIRLHQIKFMSKTGIPPVDKGLLMCYNMGNLKNPSTNNSIIETSELKKYIGNLSNYPLHLDLALPLFSWKVLFRHNEYAGLVQNLPDNILTASFVQKKENNFQLLQDTLLQGYQFKKDDILRSEESNYDEIMQAVASIKTRLKNTPIRVALYHLDSLLLSKYSSHELENIYNSMR